MLHEPQPSAVHVAFVAQEIAVQTTGPESTPLSIGVPLSVPPSVPLSLVLPSFAAPSFALPSFAAPSFDASVPPEPPLLEELAVPLEDEAAPSPTGAVAFGGA